MRLDRLLVERGLAQSRDRANRLIRAGKVMVADRVIDKPGTQVPDQAAIRLSIPDHPYVSRGGLKLVGVLDELGVRVEGVVAADLGASTGGFTDCLLRRGAARVHAVDVGYGILDYRIRTDERVRVLERTNARYLTREIVGEEIELVVADLSFISLKKVLPAIVELLCVGGEAVVLVKPQFELSRDKVGKGGIVRDESSREAAVSSVAAAAAGLGLEVVGSIRSPVLGQKGNQEFFLHLRKVR